MMNSSNPVFRSVEKDEVRDRSFGATYTGVSIKTVVLVLVSFLAAFFAATLIKDNKIEPVITIISVSGIVAFISVLIGTMIPRISMPFSILYAAAQGFTLGTLTVLLELVFPGNQIGLTAVIATGLIFAVMLGLYSIRAVRATNKFKKIMFGTLFTLLILSIIGIFVPSLDLFSSGNIFIAGLLVLFGAFMLVLDFDRAEQIVEMGASKQYEWTVALGLMVTLVWIYVQVLRVIVIVLGRRNN
ncbi:Bax inhibitor-1/YccA family protein [Haploplasma axanthum]|uniref:Bax inhibitor-1/YccA family protein n=1 Tax=Haploplasma axanthum TaxID=29552 RepID=UPI000429D579|nr:Bax inhibitor-1/YccA family protein [Haploplasma axanthum]